MSIDLRISDKPFIADIVFKDGTVRRVDFVASNLSSGYFQFMLEEGSFGAMVFVNADTVASVDFDKSASTVGGVQ